MRKLLLLILTLFIANMAVMAGRVSEAEALQKAHVALFHPNSNNRLITYSMQKAMVVSLSLQAMTVCQISLVIQKRVILICVIFLVIWNGL